MRLSIRLLVHLRHWWLLSIYLWNISWGIWNSRISWHSSQSTLWTDSTLWTGSTLCHAVATLRPLLSSSWSRVRSLILVYQVGKRWVIISIFGSILSIVSRSWIATATHHKSAISSSHKSWSPLTRLPCWVISSLSLILEILSFLRRIF
jgi:hypothetical protein